jgi:hypothetical protein
MNKFHPLLKEKKLARISKRIQMDFAGSFFIQITFGIA